MNRYPLVVLLAASLAFPACQKDSPAAPVETVVPLAVGNAWTYRLIRFDAQGAPTDTSEYTRTVVKDTLIGSTTWYRLDNRALVRNGPRGYAAYGADGEDNTIYQNSSTGGSAYRLDFPAYQLLVYTVPDFVPTTVVTPAGSFASRHYHVEDQFTYPGQSGVQIARRDDDVAGGVGLVQSRQYYRESSTLQQLTELVRYRLQ